MEPKSPDYIMVKDYRESEKYPSVHILNKYTLQEHYSVGKAFKLKPEGDDGFGDSNLYDGSNDFIRKKIAY